MPQDVDEIISEFKSSKAFQEEFGNKIDNLYRVGTKTSKEWKRYFAISIPVDASLRQCRELLSQISNLHQEASYLKTDFQLRYQLLLSARTRKYNETLGELIAGYRERQERPPARDLLVSEAESHIKDMDEALVHADAALQFFKSVVTILEQHRKVLESMIMALGIEAKLSEK